MSRFIVTRKEAEIAEGSLSAIAKRENISLAESFADAKLVIMLDVSGSMEQCDAPIGGDFISRHDAAEEQVRKLQKKYEGKVALFCFSGHVLFVPDGIPVRLNGGTAMNGALRFLKRADGIGLDIVLVSDGSPTDSEEAVLKTASTFSQKIDCIFIGPESDYSGGREFLQRLAQISGGRFVATEEVAIFLEDVEQLMLTA